MISSHTKNAAQLNHERVKEFYTKSALWTGTSPCVADHDRARAASIERLCGDGVRSILELGAGDGATAAATSELGYDVIALEFCPPLAEQARKLSYDPRKGLFIVIDEDYYDVELNNTFDVVCMWDSFGAGSDSDQRLLLRRIAKRWIATGGCALIDVFSPWWWARRAGEEFHLPGGALSPQSVDMVSRYDFDPIGGRFINTRYPTNEENKAVTQSTRCYTPADLALLLEGTGLRIDLIEAAGKTLGMDSLNHSANSPLWESGSYLAKLVADDSSSC
jgi:SAM-dependent methyltransferase